MTAKVDSPEWKAKLNDVIFDFYLEHGAPKRFYRGDCVPCKLLDYIDPSLCQNYGEVLLFINATDDGAINAQCRDFILFTSQGIVTCDDASKGFHAWSEISERFMVQIAKATQERWSEMADLIAKQISNSLVTKIVEEESREVLANFVRCVIRVLVGIDELPPAQLPYLPLPPEVEAPPVKGKTASVTTEPRPTPKMAKNDKYDKYQVDF